MKSFVDGLVSVDEGADLEAFLDGGEEPRWVTWVFVFEVKWS